MSSLPTYRSYRHRLSTVAPLCEPPMEDWQKALRENQRSLRLESVTLNGRSLSDLRRLARVELMAHVNQYRSETDFSEKDPSPHKQTDLIAPSPERLILSGHQPELFHPGVWYKNFLLSDSAKRLQATAVNLIIDQDLCRTLAIKVPTHDASNLLRVESVAIEPISTAQPWELLYPKRIEDWESFPERVRQTLGPFDKGPKILDAMWPTVLSALERGMPVGESLALARHSLEREIGLETWEIPLSRLFSTESFASFFFEVVRRPLHFREVYNSCRHGYRTIHRIRNQVHPVPALESSPEWTEVPFWVYSKLESTRRSLWCRVDSDSSSDHYCFSDRKGWEREIPSEEIRNHPDQAMKLLQSDGVSIRTRALTTTMFARLLLSDLFLHGIGGGKYDQLTDRILKEWLDIKPPNYCVASATFHYPLAIDTDKTESVAEIRSQWWFERHHLERMDSPSFSNRKKAEKLSEEKRELLQAIPARGNKLAWHTRMKRINLELQESAKVRLDGLLDRIPFAEMSQRQRSMALSREFSFVLFRQEVLANDLRKLAASLGDPSFASPF